MKITDPILAQVAAWVGRSHAEMSCWQLVHKALVLRGTPIPGDFYTLLLATDGYFTTITEPEPWDIVAIANHRLPLINHVGLYLGAGEFIHSIEDSGVVISRIDRAPWSKRIVTDRATGKQGFLRCRA